jgi:hypothetical protein
MVRYVVKFRVDMALLAEGETYSVAFYKYGPPDGSLSGKSHGHRRKDE